MPVRSSQVHAELWKLVRLKCVINVGIHRQVERQLMNAIVMLPSVKPRVPRASDLMIAFNVPANDGCQRAAGGIFGAEEALNVSFVGLSGDEARRALGSFPGARRCVLADN
jgi:hypothetical protein